MTAAPRHRRLLSGSTAVGSGIVLSRLSGLVRESVIAHVLGVGVATDAFRNAVRIPNLLQNLLGEGSLSASFIPVYAGLLDRDDPVEARRVAGAVFGGLLALTGFFVVLGVAGAGLLARLIAPGAPPATRRLTVELLRVTTVGIGFLVLSAWCLGVLNAHRRFFVSYVAPVVWNAAQIVALVTAALVGMTSTDAVRALAWGLVVGGALQFAVQIPLVWRLSPGLRPSWRRASAHTREVWSRFLPAVAGRGAVQASAWVDVVLASLLVTGAVSILLYAQILYILPISVFAMSVAASELPELASLVDRPVEAARRAEAGARRIAFFTVFVAAAYVATGEHLVGALLRRGRFDGSDTVAVWLVLAAMAVGIPAASTSRLLQNTLYALGDARGPARAAVQRVVVAAAVGALLMFPFDGLSIVDGALSGSLQGFERPPPAVREAPTGVHLGAVGLALGVAVAAWTELVLLERLVRRNLPQLGPVRRILAPLAIPAVLSLVTGAAVSRLLAPWPPLLAAPPAVGAAGIVYVLTAARVGIDESRLVLGPLRRLVRGR